MNYPTKLRKRLIAAVFGFFFLLNILTSGGHLDWWDGIEAFLVTENMALSYSAKLDPESPSLETLPFDVRYSVFSNKVIQTGDKTLDRETISLEPVYTVRSLFLSAIGVPFYYLALALSLPPIVLIGLLVNSMIIALTSVVIFCFSHEVYRSIWISFILSLIFGVCSFIWPYHTSFWTQPLQGLTLVLGTYFLYKSIHLIPRSPQRHQIASSSSMNHEAVRRKGIYFILLGGLFLGLSISAHASSIIFIPGFILYVFWSLRRTRKRLILYFLASLVTTSFFVGLTNYWRFGSFTEFGYGYFATPGTHNGWAGLIGLLLSPGAGLVFFFPISILLIFAAKEMYSTNRGLLFICSYIIIVNWLHVGTLSFGSEPYSWSGAIAWGPRYLLPVLPFVTIILGQLLSSITKLKDRKKKLVLKSTVISLAALGFYINLVGTLVWYQYGYVYGWDREDLSQFSNGIDIFTWHPYYSPIVLHTKALTSDFVATIHPEEYLNTSWYWISYGLAPCSYDIYILCEFGIIAFILASIPTITLALFIVYQIRKEKPVIRMA